MVQGPTAPVDRQPGTSLRAKNDGAMIYEAVGNWNLLREVVSGTVVEAAGSVVTRGSTKYVPILPEGCVQVGAGNGFTAAEYPLTRPTAGAYPDRSWPAKIGNPPDFLTLDRVIDAFIKSALILITSEPSQDAVACFLDIKSNCETRVLATAKVGKWITGWGCSIAQLIFTALVQCAVLWLIAVKGGPACDEELVLTEYILILFGFKRVNESICIEQGSFYYDEWHKTREGAMDMTVYVQVHCTPEDVKIAQPVAPVKKHAAAPNLARVAIISAPAGAIDGINHMVKLEMDAAMELAQKKGWRPDANPRESEEAMAAYSKYFFD